MHSEDSHETVKPAAKRQKTAGEKTDGRKESDLSLEDFNQRWCLAPIENNTLAVDTSGSKPILVLESKSGTFMDNDYLHTIVRNSVVYSSTSKFPFSEFAARKILKPLPRDSETTSKLLEVFGGTIICNDPDEITRPQSALNLQLHQGGFQAVVVDASIFRGEFLMMKRLVEKLYNEGTTVVEVGSRVDGNSPATFSYTNYDRHGNTIHYPSHCSANAGHPFHCTVGSDRTWVVVPTLAGSQRSSLLHRLCYIHEYKLMFFENCQNEAAAALRRKSETMRYLNKAREGLNRVQTEGWSSELADIHASTDRLLRGAQACFEYWALFYLSPEIKIIKEIRRVLEYKLKKQNLLDSEREQFDMTMMSSFELLLESYTTKIEIAGGSTRRGAKMNI